MPDIPGIGHEQRRASDIESDGITTSPLARRKKSRLVEKKPRRITDERQAEKTGGGGEREEAVPYAMGELLPGTVAGPIHE